MYQCQECGKNFLTVKSAERAQRNGCSCGGTDIDLVRPPRLTPGEERRKRAGVSEIAFLRASLGTLPDDVGK
jgi:hypothetical protein